MAKYRTNNRAIWSHCLQWTFGVLWGHFSCFLNTHGHSIRHYGGQQYSWTLTPSNSNLPRSWSYSLSARKGSNWAKGQRVKLLKSYPTSLRLMEGAIVCLEDIDLTLFLIWYSGLAEKVVSLFLCLTNWPEIGSTICPCCVYMS